MGTCLITTLKENVADDELLKLGELRGYLKKSNTILMLSLSNNPEIHIKVTSPCYFTDSSGTSNLGTQITLNEGSRNVPVYISSKNGDGFITFDNKYGMLDFMAYANPTDISSSICELFFEDIVGMPLNQFIIGRLGAVGDVNAINNITANTINLTSDEQGTPKLTGNVSDLKNSQVKVLNLRKSQKLTGSLNVFGDRSRFPLLRVLHVSWDLNLTGNLSAFTGKDFTQLGLTATQLTGDIAMLTGNSDLEILYVENTNVTGTLSSIASLFPEMKNLIVSGTSVSGDTSELAGLTELIQFNYTNCPNITGTWPLI